MEESPCVLGNARASTFLLGAESLAIIVLVANGCSVRSYIPILNSRSKGFRIAGWFFSVPLHRGGFGFPGKEAVGSFERVKD